MKSPSELSSFLPTLFTGKPLSKRFRESAIWRVWDKAVGQPLASKARPAAFREGVLTVVVSSAPWMQQLGFLKRQIIESVNSALGEDLVTEIYLKAGRPIPSPPPLRPPRRPARHLTTEELTRIEQEASAIPDEELRAAFTRFYTTWLSQRWT